MLRALLRSPLARALSAPHGVDAYLRALNPRWSVDDVSATIEAVVAETPTAATLTLRPNFAWDGHAAGQHVRVGVDLAGVRHVRCFSISSGEHGAAKRDSGRITLTIRAVGKVSRHLAFDARPGDMLSLSQAQGDFVLPLPRPRRILLLSAGSGITPVMSMLRTLRHERHAGEIVFAHYARSREELIYREELDGLRAAREVKTIVILGDHFSPAHLSQIDVPSFETFLCGPEPMMSLVRRAYPGLPFHQERFSAELVSSSNDSGGDVHFAASGVRKPCDGRSLLMLAEEAGLAPDSGCRRGICHTCTRRKVRGVVRDLRTGALSRDDEAEIQICVSAPVGDVTIDL